MGQDLAAIGPSAIVCVAFLVGVWMVLRHELAPKRRAGAKDDDESGEMSSERGEGSES
jgi:hypothetical protein